MDLLFILNLLLDMYLILFTGLLLRQSTTCLRIIGAASLGSLFSCLGTWIELSTSIFHNFKIYVYLLYVLLALGIVPVFMLYIAFGRLLKKKLLENLFTFYGIAVFTGGMMVSIKNLSFTFHCLYSEKINRNMLCTWLLIVCVLLITTVVLIIIYRKLYLRSVEMHTIYKMRLEHKGAAVHLNVLLDTGNCLVEPVSNTPICIVEAHLLTGLKCCETSMDKSWIVYQAVGTKNGKMPVYCIDRLIICKEKKVWSYEHMYIGCYEGVFNQKGNYQGILHPALVQ